jgi:hypothetical protein
MQTQNIVVDRVEARALYRKYREHQHYSTPIDWEIQRTYQLIAQGRLVIRALDSITAAGVGEDGYPKLAIIRADARDCFLRYDPDGRVVFAADWRSRSPGKRIELPAGSFPARARYIGGWDNVKAQVPLIPIHLRPKRGLQNYHILFEAEWRPVPPQDPLLLRRVGKSDLWVVCAAWDLTPIERAVLASRINA